MCSEEKTLALRMCSAILVFGSWGVALTLIILNAIKVISINWFWCFLPIWLPFIVLFILLLISYIILVKKGEL